MIDVFVHDPENPPPKLRAILSRTTDFEPDLLASAQEVVRAVRERGDDAVLEYTREFDGVDLSADGMRVPETDIQAAYREADPDLIRTMRAAADNIRRFHDAQKADLLVHRRRRRRSTRQAGAPDRAGRHSYSRRQRPAFLNAADGRPFPPASPA